MSSLKTELYEALQHIPRGNVTTYDTLAKYFHSSPRAIASMLAANTELDRYPCYKVIHTDGRIWGYHGGVAEKIRRLEADGIKITRGKVDLKKYGFGEF